MIKGILDNFVNIQRFIRDMVKQNFLNFGEFWIVCQFLFRDVGYFSNYLKEYGIPGFHY